MWLVLLAGLGCGRPLWSQAPYLGGSGDGYARVQGTFLLTSSRGMEIAPGISLSPNPCPRGTEPLLHFPVFANPVRLSLLDFSGKEIQRLSAVSPNARLPFSNLPSGSYWIQIEYTGQWFTIPWVVQ